MKKIVLMIALLNMLLLADFKSIDATELKKLQKESVPVIDIRTEGEWTDTGIIKGAHKITFFSEQGQALLADWFFEVGHLVKDRKEPFIIYCAHASRTASLSQGLREMGFENVYELKGGIENGWIKAGEKVVKE